MRRLFLVLMSPAIFLACAALGASARTALDVFVTPIPNAPFRGAINVERSFVQQDGSIVNFKTIRDIGRDSRGRIYNESRGFIPVSSTQTPQVVTILLYDPQTRISTILNPRERVFRTQTVNRPPGTGPPALLYASPVANSMPPNQFTREEDLGIHEMEGVPAHGVREIQIIAPENSGTGKEIIITDEYWYSEDLRINLVIKHSDPRTGGVTMRVTQVTRTEPDPALFEIPDGYTPGGMKREAKQ